MKYIGSLEITKDNYKKYENLVEVTGDLYFAAFLLILTATIAHFSR